MTDALHDQTLASLSNADLLDELTSRLGEEAWNGNTLTMPITFGHMIDLLRSGMTAEQLGDRRGAFLSDGLPVAEAALHALFSFLSTLDDEAHAIFGQGLADVELAADPDAVAINTYLLAEIEPYQEFEMPEVPVLEQQVRRWAQIVVSSFNHHTTQRKP